MFSVYLQVVQSSPSLEYFNTPKEAPYPLAVILHSPFLPALGNHKSTFCPHACAHFGHFVQTELYSM